VTMRSKTDYVIEEDQRGRKVPRKVGLKPEQREGIEYEFDIVGDLDHENTLVVSKSRARTLAGRVVAKPDADFAQEIAAWLGDGKPSPDALHFRDLLLDQYATLDDVAEAGQEIRKRGLFNAQIVDEHGDAVALGELARRRWSELSKAKPSSDGGEAA
jgi:hypothetical protein